MSAAIALRGVDFAYGRRRVLQHVDLEVPAGSFTAARCLSGSVLFM